MHALALAASAAASHSGREAIGWGLLIAVVLAAAIWARRWIRGGSSSQGNVVGCQGGHSAGAWAAGILLLALVAGYGYDQPRPAAHAPAPARTVTITHTITKVIHQAPAVSGTDIVLIVLISCIAAVCVIVGGLSVARRFL